MICIDATNNNVFLPFFDFLVYNRFVELEKEVLLPLSCWAYVPALALLIPLPYVSVVPNGY